MVTKLVQQIFAFVVRQAFDADRRRRIQVKCFTATHGMGVDQGMRHIGGLAADGLGIGLFALITGDPFGVAENAAARRD